MKFLYRKFIKDYKNTKDNNVRAKYGILSGVVGIICNIILSTFKLIIGIIANSISIIGDAINNLGDMLNSIINIFSFKINSKPADKKHPYGHRRSEYVGGLVISILIIVVAIELLTSSIEKIFNPSHTRVSFYLLLVLLLNIIIKTFMALVYRSGAKTINSLSLMASYKDSLMDIVTNTVIVVGLFIGNYIGIDIDGYLGILLSFFIVFSVSKIIKESIDKLLGESLKEETLVEITNEILKDRDIYSVHDILTHQYGEGKVFMSVHVEMDASYSLLESHDIVDRIERKIKGKYDVELIIHIDPVDFSNKELLRIKNLVTGILYQIDENLSSHDVRITGGKNKRLYFDLAMPYSYHGKSKEILDIVISEIICKCDYRPSIEINYK